LLRIVIAPDKFKGSLSAPAVASAIACGVIRAEPSADVAQVPMADGGEGTVDALVAATAGCERTVRVEGPLGRLVDARFGLLGDQKTAVLEMAAASGLVLVAPQERDPFHASTFGTGQLLLAAAGAGVERLIIGIGGSATNDGGVGLGQALGYRFFDENDHEMSARGAACLRRIQRIDGTLRNTALDGLKIEVACDVDNPLIGPCGASVVFGPQKFATNRPATADQIRELDEGLAHLALVVRRDLGVSIADHPGAGAAGGLGAGLIAFANGQLTPGIDLVIDAVRLRSHLAQADLCLTGEGLLDGSTVGGKTVAGVARLARRLGVPAIAMAGGIGQGAEDLLELGLDAYFCICNSPTTLERAMREAEPLLASTSEQIVRVFLAGQKKSKMHP
jgi:glycerate kinase